MVPNPGGQKEDSPRLNDDGGEGIVQASIRISRWAPDPLDLSGRAVSPYSLAQRYLLRRCHEPQHLR
jgi:hypothetical protein